MSSLSISSSDERSRSQMTNVNSHQGDDQLSREETGNIGINEARAAAAAAMAAAAMAANEHPNDGSLSSHSTNQPSSCQRMTSSSANSQPSLYHQHKASQLETLQSFQSVMSHQLQQQQNIYAHPQQTHSSHSSHSSHHLQVPSSSSSNPNSSSSASLLHSWASDYNFIWPSSTSNTSSFGARLQPHHAHQFSAASSFASSHHNNHQSSHHHHNQSHHLGHRNLT